MFGVSLYSMDHFDLGNFILLLKSNFDDVNEPEILGILFYRWCDLLGFKKPSKNELSDKFKEFISVAKETLELELIENLANGLDIDLNGV